MSTFNSYENNCFLFVSILFMHCMFAVRDMAQRMLSTAHFAIDLCVWTKLKAALIEKCLKRLINLIGNKYET